MRHSRNLIRGMVAGLAFFASAAQACFTPTDPVPPQSLIIDRYADPEQVKDPTRYRAQTEDYIHGVFGDDWEWSEVHIGGHVYRTDGFDVIEDRSLLVTDLDDDGRNDYVITLANE